MSPVFRRTRTAALLAACATLGSAALAEPATSTNAQASPPAIGTPPEVASAPADEPRASSPAGVSGMVAIIDPGTGRLRIGGGADELELPYDPELDAALSERPEDVEVTMLPDGTRIAHILRGYQTAVFALRARDGSIRLTESFVITRPTTTDSGEVNDHVCD